MAPLDHDVARRLVTLTTRSEPMTIDPARTAVLVVDMQNDFGAKGGMFDRAGIDLSMIQGAVGPISNVLEVAREAGITIIYLKMGFHPDLSDLGAADAPNRVRHLLFGVGEAMRAPDGSASRVLIRDTWNTDIIPELARHAGDHVVYKHRYSGFFETNLDALLKQLGVTYLIVTGCTTSVCVESTVRDAFFRDYQCVVLADCTAEPIAHNLPRSNHEASLLLFQLFFGWVADSNAVIDALDVQPAAVAPEQGESSGMSLAELSSAAVSQHAAGAPHEATSL